jgi:hypothetical protein
MTVNVHSNSFYVEFDVERDMLVVRHPDHQEFKTPFIEIRRETLNEMTFKQASEFIGERLILLIPSLKAIYQDYLWTENGEPPRKV